MVAYVCVNNNEMCGWHVCVNVCVCVYDRSINVMTSMCVCNVYWSSINANG
jgi:hypothetical protein